MKQLTLLILMLITTGGILAQTIKTDRPSQSNSSVALSKGDFQIESALGIEIIGSDMDGLYERNILLPTSLFRVGIADNFELRMKSTMFLSQIKSSFGNSLTQNVIDDLQLGFKWRFTSGSDYRTQLALVSHVSIPTGNFTENNFGFINTLVFSKSFTDKLSYIGNIGHVYRLTGNGDLKYSFVLKTGITDKLTLFIEGFGSYVDFKDVEINADAGFALNLTDKTQLDYSFGVGLNNRYNFHQLGFSILFN